MQQVTRGTGADQPLQVSRGRNTETSKGEIDKRIYDACVSLISRGELQAALRQVLFAFPENKVIEPQSKFDTKFAVFNLFIDARAFTEADRLQKDFQGTNYHARSSETLSRNKREPLDEVVRQDSCLQSSRPNNFVQLLELGYSLDQLKPLGVEWENSQDYRMVYDHLKLSGYPQEDLLKILTLWVESPTPSTLFSNPGAKEIPFYYECLQVPELRPQILKHFENVRELHFLKNLCFYAANEKNDLSLALEIVPCISFPEMRWDIYDELFKECRSPEEFIQALFGNGPASGHIEAIGNRKSKSVKEYEIHLAEYEKHFREGTTSDGEREALLRERESLVAEHATLYSLLKAKGYPVSDRIGVVGMWTRFVGRVGLTVPKGFKDWNWPLPARKFVDDNIATLYAEFTESIQSPDDLLARVDQALAIPESENKLQDFKFKLFQDFIEKGADLQMFVKSFERIGGGGFNRFLYLCLQITELKPFLLDWFQGIWGGAAYQRQRCENIYNITEQEWVGIDLSQKVPLCRELALRIQSRDEQKKLPLEIRPDFES